ncbi:MAG TPA: ABC transporter permease [Thermomicrobiales bacterium]|nr:ABC transporter permease [Chloroflexota bacterium]HQZ90313.1 ABC transporter permease [Thermomicrobiales bacterium]HRA31077.1 ABC transporter permease [Thermomicrobiales bacterium]
MAEAPDAQIQGSPAAAILDAGRLGSRKPRSLWSDAARQFRKHKLAVAGVFVLIFLIVITLIGPVVWPQNMKTIDFSKATIGPSLAHPMGTDDLGRDLFARVLWGGRISLAVGVTAMLVAILFGTFIGAMSGFFGGFTDSALMRFTDMFISLPTLPLLLLAMYLFRDSLIHKFGQTLGPFLLLVFLIGITNWMPVARLVRASFLSLKEKEFIEAAHCIGANRSSIIFKHILPNSMGPVIVAATLAVGSAIISESTLSFLGLGFPPDVPTWGQLLNTSVNFMEIAPHMVIFPAMSIFLAVLSINYVGDGLRDALDPRKTTG